MSQYEITEGDNIEFVGATITDYTIWLGMSGTDTATTKYADNPRSAAKLAIRMNQNGSIVSENNTTFTNTVTIIANKTHTETRNTPAITKIVLRTGTVNTQIKIRWY
ncbi:MAG: hypothetical protein CMH64_01740 [Nanoarchaeota archaeon]|jgi:hypothetical protein|nr:hypothetical protein [Nanoarchaeota archaeon]|tara:strand:+ start:45 stop:365 length:321 start_codon:yes stop_codon:yes gene_type:complete